MIWYEVYIEMKQLSLINTAVVHNARHEQRKGTLVGDLNRLIYAASRSKYKEVEELYVKLENELEKWQAVRDLMDD